MKLVRYYFLSLIAIHVTMAQDTKITIGNSYSDYVTIKNVFNNNYNETVVTLEFYPNKAISATLHAPNGTSPFVLADKKGNRYALKTQYGWGGTLAGGFGTINLKANEKKIVNLYFNNITNVKDLYSLTEVDCSTNNCWNFYDIKVEFTKEIATAKHDSLWIDYDTYENDNFGMHIHYKFTINNMKDKRCYLILRFMIGEEFIKSEVVNYKNDVGQLSLKRYLTPNYDNTIFKDVKLFLPYSYLTEKLSYGKHNIKIDVDVHFEDNTLLNHLALQEFTFAKR